MPDLRGRKAARTLRVDQVSRDNEFAAPIALVASRVVVVAHWALALHKSVRQKARAFNAVLLVHNLFKCLPLFIDVVENVLCNLGLLRGTRPAPLVEVTVEPVVDLLVNNSVVVTNLLRGFAFLHRFGLGGSAILVGTAHVNAVMPRETCVPCVDVC